MKRTSIASRKERTRKKIAESGHELYLLYQGGAHTRWACGSCSEQFVIEEFRPPETPGYYDGNKWRKCKAVSQ
jgi:hypothetical protein